MTTAEQHIDQDGRIEIAFKKTAAQQPYGPLMGMAYLCGALGEMARSGEYDAKTMEAVTAHFERACLP